MIRLSHMQSAMAFAAAFAQTQPSKPADTHTGHQVIEDALTTAAKGDWNRSPAGYSPEEGRAYQAGLAAAYQHALEMIPPSV